MLKQFSILSVFTLINLLSSGSCDSLIDLPLSLKPGNYLIHATLTELDSGLKFYIQEYISSTSKLTRGKISITSDKIGSVDVHYSTGSNKIQRLVIRDNQCDLLTYKNASKWGTKLSGISNQFTSDILLLGPSLVYRLGHSSIYWQQDKDTTIRGVAVKSINTRLPDYTYITALYKKTLDSGTGIIQPTRLELSDTTNTYKFTRSSKLLLDFYLQTETSEETDKLVTPQPGIGCVTYLADGLPNQVSSVPLVGKNQLHYITVENVVGPEQTSTRNQFFADHQDGLMYLETTSAGKTVSQIYDFTLGVIYQWKDSVGCLLSAIQANSPGVNYYRKFSLTALLGTDSVFHYVGQVNYERRSGFQVDVWEAIENTYNQVAYDKVVKTLYFVHSFDPESIFGYVPVGATINLYNKKSSGGYSLIQSVEKVYYDFGAMNGAEEYRNRFQVSDCYPDAEKQKTLALHFSCNSSIPCGFFAKQKSYDFRGSIKNALLDTAIVSASRISNIDLSFDDNETIAYVTFLDVPPFKNVFKFDYLSLAKESLYSRTSFSMSADSCLSTNAFTAESFEALVYCDKTNACAKIKSFDSLVENKENGTFCKVYRFPLRNYYRFSRETQLDKLQSEFSRRRVTFRFIGFPMPGAIESATYKLSSIEDVTEKQDEVEQLFETAQRESKLVQDDENVLMVENVNNFGDCYRACVNADENSCETLSFCQYPDRVECLVSTVNHANISKDGIAFDAACKIYSANHLSEYVKIPNRQFRSNLLSQTIGWSAKCANLCHTSDECKSFQVCAGTCSFSESYTDSITKYSSSCNIYIPKVSHKFTVTGTKIVTVPFHTEYNLNIDQCAALCYDWKYTNETCISFNYCSKAKAVSSCSLTKFSVKDATTQTTESNSCQNYQLTDQDSSNDKINKKQVDGQIVASGTSGGAAFGIIVMFLVVGLVVGFGAPFVYKKTQSILTATKSSPQMEAFTWTKQVNEDDDQHSVI